jgi:hypothetical protein
MFENVCVQEQLKEEVHSELKKIDSGNIIMLKTGIIPSLFHNIKD